MEHERRLTIPSSLVFSASAICSFVLYSLTILVLTSVGGRRERGERGKEGGQEGGRTEDRGREDRGREGERKGGREGEQDEAGVLDQFQDTHLTHTNTNV